MKVLFDAHAIGQKKTGLETYSLNLCKRLKTEKDLDLVLYTNKGKNIFSSNGIYRVFLGFGGLIKKDKPDLIHTTYFTPFIKRIPTIVTVHDICFDLFPETFPKMTLLAFELFFKRSLKSADAIICGSETVKKQISKLYGISNEKIFVTYYGVDKRFGYIQNRTKVKKFLKNKFGIRKKYFLVVGNIEKRKNPKPIIDAFLKLPKSEDVDLIFAGKNKIGQGFMINYKDLISNEKIKILGYVSEEDLNYLYNGSEALVYNSICEGFGFPIVEAMSTKTVVICSDLPVFREITGNSSLFYKNSRELSVLMEHVLKNKKYSIEYVKKGYLRSKFFSWEKTSRETYKVYKKVLKNTSLYLNGF